MPAAPRPPLRALLGLLALVLGNPVLGNPVLGALGTAPAAGATPGTVGQESSRSAAAGSLRLVRGWARSPAQLRERVDLDLLHSTLEPLEACADRSLRREADLALCELVGVLSRREASPRERELGAVVQQSLGRRAVGVDGAELRRYLCREVLLLREAVPAQARAGAAAILGLDPGAEELGALLASSADPDAEVRLAALRSLCGQAEPRIAERQVAALAAAGPESGAAEWNLLGEHLRRLRERELLSAGLAAADREALGALVFARAVDPEWRRAAPAVALFEYLPAETAVPRAIEALHLWTRREAEGVDGAAPTGVRRLRHQCAGALFALTGREIGPDPERWRQFWAAVQEGVPLQLLGSAAESTTVAQFFGLAIHSSALAFVVDASGSMDSAFDRPDVGRTRAARPRTRFDVAARELLTALENNPPPTHFRVILFDDRADVWRREAASADRQTLAQLAGWLRARGPDGGTVLATGLEQLVGDGEPATLRRLDVDTVVVLCDGETVESREWAQAWLERYNPEAQLVFHCVQLGGARAGALEALATGSGGTFLRLQ